MLMLQVSGATLLKERDTPKFAGETRPGRLVSAARWKLNKGWQRVSSTFSSGLLSSLWCGSSASREGWHALDLAPRDSRCSGKEWIGVGVVDSSIPLNESLRQRGSVRCSSSTGDSTNLHLRLHEDGEQAQPCMVLP